MARFSLTGVIVLVVAFLVLSGFIAANIDVGGTHQELPGISENVTASNLLSEAATDFSDWFKANIWSW